MVSNVETLFCRTSCAIIVSTFDLRRPKVNSARARLGRPDNGLTGDYLAWRPGERPSTEEVHVEVEDGLAGAGADVEDGAVSLFDVALASDVGGGEVAATDEFGVGGLSFFQSSKMFLRNDENVRGGLRIDVFEGEDMVILVNFFGGNFAANHAAEEAIGGSVSHGEMWLQSADKNHSTWHGRMSAGAVSARFVGSFRRPYRTLFGFGSGNPPVELAGYFQLPLRGGRAGARPKRERGRGRPRHIDLVEAHQEDCAFGGCGFGGEFLGAVVVVVEDADADPPVSGRTVEAQDIGRAIAALEVIGEFGGRGFVGESADLYGPFSGGTRSGGGLH